MKIIVKCVHRLNYSLYFTFRYLFGGIGYSLSKIKIANSKRTIKYIIEHKASVSRFGDGELSLANGDNTGFQSANVNISNKLRKILGEGNTCDFIVCLPHPWKELYFGGLNYYAFEYWTSFLDKTLRTLITPHIKSHNLYYDTNFTRFYIDYKSDKKARTLVPIMKEIWEGKEILFVEGEYSRLGVGNDLFDNAKSIKRILCPSRNAFDKYEEIIYNVSKQPKDILILIALGMTATCLSYDLHQLGYWAIDIGHVDVEYEWWKMKAKKRVPIRGKFVAEVSMNEPEPLTKAEMVLYNSQIIAKIGI